jgi:hypothetical protein
MEDALGVTLLSSGDTATFGGASEQYHEPTFQLEVIELVDGEAAIEIPLLEVPSAFHRLVQEP